MKSKFVCLLYSKQMLDKSIWRDIMNESKNKSQTFAILTTYLSGVNIMWVDTSEV